MKKIIYILCALCVTSTLTSCEDLFDTESDRQVFDPALNEKTDSMFYTLGILKGLQQLGDQYVLVNEMRGDLTATNSYTETSLKQLATFNVDETNKFDSAYLYYRVINNCNYYIAHRDTNLLTGSRKVAIPEYAEALAIRAWTYMQLAKIYGKVPFYTTPLTSIADVNAQYETKDLQGIFDALEAELVRYSGTIVPIYGSISAGVLNSSSTDNPVEKSVSSKIAMFPIDLVLADLYLETHQYEKAAQYYFKFIQKNMLETYRYGVLPTTYEKHFSVKLPNDLSVTVSGYWKNIFATNSTIDLVTCIPFAANRLRGVTTNLPRYFGYDFYSTTGGSSSSSSRYLLERQIDASQAYLNLSASQLWYYRPQNSTTTAKTLMIGDLRRYASFEEATKGDSAFSVMIKFNNANIPIYRYSTIYLRLAEAINRMGYPDAAFAILKDGLSEGNLTSYDYFRSTPPDGRVENTLQFLTSTIPFFAEENKSVFRTLNKGIHSRGTNYTEGTFSPYQLDTIVGEKIKELDLNLSRPLTLADTINAVEDLICDEMALELAFEGSRFGDLTRIARHKNKEALYGANYGSKWLAKKLAYKQAAVSLEDENNWFLPFR